MKYNLQESFFQALKCAFTGKDGKVAKFFQKNCCCFEKNVVYL